VFTAILFMIGKFGITLYIGSSEVTSAYGTAGSLAILRLWVYFSALILYFGAEFTRCYAIQFGSEIRPDKYAVIVQTVQVESKKRSVQEHDKDSEHTEKVLQEVNEELEQKNSVALIFSLIGM
jgi:membrane protein